jgi:hypothetical protein
MTALDSGTGVAGSGTWASLRCDYCTSLGSELCVCHPQDFTHFDYPGIYEDQNFHHCGLEPNDTIVNYDNEIEVWTCELDGLAEYASFFGAHLLV